MRRTAPPQGELALIEEIRRGASTRKSPAVALGIGDDCAILRPPDGHEVLVTTDFTLENRHFRREWHTPESVGHRCLARGLSDLAAMGTSPMAAFLSLALPAGYDPRWVSRFFAGLHALAGRFRVPLAGGDTAEAPEGLVLADIVLLGAAPAGEALRRSGARPGNGLYVTGGLGGAAAELEAMQAGRSRPARSDAAHQHPQMFPEPRLVAGRQLRGVATACLDVSDGLSTDLAHLCGESNVGAEVEAERLPLHPLAARLGRDHALRLALDGGEDYELLFTAPEGARVPKRIGGVPMTRIGRIVPRRNGITLLSADGERTELKPGGWEHLR